MQESFGNPWHGIVVKSRSIYELKIQITGQFCEGFLNTNSPPLALEVPDLQINEGCVLFYWCVVAYYPASYSVLWASSGIQFWQLLKTEYRARQTTSWPNLPVGKPS